MISAGFGYTPESRKEEGIVPLLGVDENTLSTNFSGVSKHGILSAKMMADATRKGCPASAYQDSADRYPDRDVVGRQSAEGRHRPLGLCQQPRSSSRRANPRCRCRGESTDLRDHSPTGRRRPQRDLRLQRDRGTAACLRSRARPEGRHSSRRIQITKHRSGRFDGCLHRWTLRETPDVTRPELQSQHPHTGQSPGSQSRST
jgi:hypothetical protein